MQVGGMTSVLLVTQVVMNLLLSRLSDVWSRKWVIVLGSVSAAASAILALVVKEPALFYLVFVLTGIAATAFWTIGITISLEFGDESQRPTYVGMSNTLISPATILVSPKVTFYFESFRGLIFVRKLWTHGEYRLK